MTESFIKSTPALPGDFVPNDFAAATLICPTTSELGNVYNTDLKQDWCIGLVPEGGYLGAVIAQAAKFHLQTHHAELNQPDLITMHQEFISACTIGPAKIEVTNLSLGRQYSTVRVQLFQYSNGDRTKKTVLRIETLVRQGNLERESTSRGISLPTRPLREKLGKFPNRKDCVERKDEPRIFVRRTAYAKVIMLLSSDTNELGKDPEIGPSVREQWVTWRSEERGFDVTSLCFLADTFRPLVEVYEVEGNWFPTLNYGVEVKKAPPKDGWKWLYMRIESMQIKDGRFDLNVIIADEAGELVAMSKQTALIVPSSRNYKRSTESKM